MSGWGGLADPLHHEVATAPDGPPWRENVFFAFWDRAASTYGTIHAMTSPNAEGRRARISLAVDGRQAEVIEPLDPMVLRSAAIDVDLDGKVRAATSDLAVDLVFSPRLAPIDYTAAQSLPGLVEAEPLHHFQGSATVEGTATVAGATVEVRGTAIRDRTWGWREEVQSWAEYYAFFLCFDGFDVTMMKFRETSGRDRVGGFLVGDRSGRVTGSRITRTAAGLFAGITLSLDGGELLDLRGGPRQAGFFVPLGVEREGAAICVYDEFLPVHTGDGEAGFGMVEQGILRQVP
jgi:hypothetical protein